MAIMMKLKVLEQVCEVYADFVSGLDIECRRYCSVCCTSDVTITTLEGFRVLDYLDPKGEEVLHSRIQAMACEQRFQPKVTINRIAEICINGEDLPEEKKGEKSGSCPFLTENECPIYPVRPFGCRCMVSKHNCKNSGFAEIDDYTLAVNNLFLQVIEHIDSGGCTGNLADILIRLSSCDKKTVYLKETRYEPERTLISNRPIKVMMIPSEYREKIQPVLKALQGITY